MRSTKLGVPQRECKPNLKSVKDNKDLLESIFSTGIVKQVPGWEKSHAVTIAWSYDMERTCEEMRGKILRMGKKESRANIQSLHSVHG